MSNLLEKVIDAYFRKSKRKGFMFNQPSKDLTKVGRKYVYLSNINGVFAKYNSKSQRFV
ncbi:MAG: hypothetical protein M3512_14520 [Bacteroidota bacterium]|nr:hypothetical protein [Bacteroidota bacterium]